MSLVTRGCVSASSAAVRACGRPIFHVAAVLMASAPIAVAQSQAPTQADQAEGKGLEEIVVVAQRRSEKLHDVPVAISAFTTQALENRGITNLQEVNGLAANFTAVPASGSHIAVPFAIRGSVTGNPGEYWDPTVGIYVDGVYVPKSFGAIFDLPDIDHIEVLKGPQGTLYGRNSLAGAVNIVTKKPTGEFSGLVEAGFGDYGDQVGRFNINAPRIGPLSVSLAGFIEGRDGIYDNVARPGAFPLANGKLDSIDEKSLHFAAALDVTDTLSFDYTFDYTNANDTPSPYILTYIGTGKTNPVAIFTPGSPHYVGIPLSSFVNPLSRSSTVSLNGGVNNAPIGETDRIWAHALTITDQVGGVTLKSITGYRWTDWTQSLDLDGSPLPVASAYRGTTFHNFSEELNASGTVDDLTFSAGLYYYADGGGTVNPQQFFFGASQQFPHYSYSTSAYAAYGQVDYIPRFIDDNLVLTAGLRYSNESKFGARYQYNVTGAHMNAAGVAVGGNAPVVVFPLGTSASKSFDDTTPTFIAKYNITSAINVYAKYAQGFKSGGINDEAPTIAELQHPFDPETVDSYEIGSKISLFDSRLQMNLSGFIEDHNNLQLSVFVPSSGTQSVVRNAGKAEVKGFEFEAQALPFSWLAVTGSLGYLSASYQQFINNGVNVANDRSYPYAPPITASLSVDATLLQGEWGNFHVLVDYTHTDQFYLYAYSLSADPNTGQSPRTAVATEADVVNLRAIVADIPVPAGTAEISFWVKNLFNENYANFGIPFGPAFGELSTSNFGEPRTLGGTLSYKF